MSYEKSFAQRIAFENEMVAIQTLTLPNLVSLDFELDTIPMPLAEILTAEPKGTKKSKISEKWTETNNNRDYPLGFTSDINRGKFGKWKSYTKTFQKEMELLADGLTAIKSEWGDIEVKIWEKNSVKFDVVATLETDRPKKAEEVLKNIEVVFKNTLEGVLAETVIHKKKAIKWNRRKNWEIKIDFVVQVPASSNLKIDHFFGGITVGDLEGAASFNIHFAAPLIPLFTSGKDSTSFPDIKSCFI